MRYGTYSSSAVECKEKKTQKSLNSIAERIVFMRFISQRFFQRWPFFLDLFVQYSACVAGRRLHLSTFIFFFFFKLYFTPFTPQAYLVENRAVWESAWNKYKTEVDRRLTAHATMREASMSDMQCSAQHDTKDETGTINFQFEQSDSESEGLPDFEDAPPQAAPAAPAAPAPKRRAARTRPSVHPGMTAGGVRTPDDMMRLWRDGRIEQLTVDRLKAYLKLQRLPVSGTKKVLMERVIMKLREEQRFMSCGSEVQSQMQNQMPSEIEMACREAPTQGMAAVGVNLQEPEMKKAVRKGRLVAAEEEDDIDDEMLRAPSPELAPRHSVTASQLGRVPRGSVSQTDRTQQWAQHLNHVEPRTSTSQYSEINVIPRPSVPVSESMSIPQSPAFFNGDAGFRCPEPSAEDRDRQVKRHLDRYQKAHAGIQD